jgi:hypothetical protein
LVAEAGWSNERAEKSTFGNALVNAMNVGRYIDGINRIRWHPHTCRILRALGAVTNDFWIDPSPASA